MMDGSISARSIFMSAIEKCSPNEWGEFLDGACAGDVALRGRVEKLLQAHLAMGRIHTSAQEPTIDPDPCEKLAAEIGNYRLMEQIGEGGMGTVFVAEQRQPLRRKVALKVIKPGMDTKEVIARFEAERQALAVMDHPNIAKVFDAGTTENGRPYFVMELVRGIEITRYCDEHELTIRERLELFSSVCQAIQHAHQKGIIHRDIKPSNVLVTEHDGRAVPKVIDFGVAKAIGHSLTDRTIYTRHQTVIGTPLYMSPEQAALSGIDVDTRSDVYSLGVLLYELLTGTTPFEQEQLRSAAQDEVLRLIREQDPPKPSTRISTLGARGASISHGRRTDVGGLGKAVRGELDWIVMKTLDKDRHRRYKTADALAEDIGRYLHNESVHACPPSTLYRLRKAVCRHRAAVLAGLLLVTALLTGFVGTNIALSVVSKERDRANDTAEKLGRQYATSLIREVHAISLARTVGYGAELLSKIRTALRMNIDESEIPQLRQDAIATLGDPLSRTPITLAPKAFPAPVTTISSSVRGSLFAVGLENGDVSIRSARTGDDISWCNFPRDADAPLAVRFLRLAPGAKQQNQRLYVGYNPQQPYDARNGNVKVWQEARVWEFVDGNWTCCELDFGGPLGGRLFTLSAGGGAVATLDASDCRTWDQVSGKLIGQWNMESVHTPPSLAVSDNGRQVAIVTGEGVLVCQVNDDGSTTSRLLGERPYVVALSGDGEKLVCGGGDSGLAVYSWKTLERQWHMRRGLPYFDNVEPSFDGRFVCWSHIQARTVAIWDTSINRKLTELAHDGLPFFASFADNGASLITYAAGPNTVNVWRLWGTEARRELWGHHGGVTCTCFSPEGDSLITTGQDAKVRLWDPRDGNPLATLPGPPGVWQTQCACFNHDGTLFAVGGWGSDRIAIWDRQSLQLLEAIPSELDAVMSLDFSDDGRYLAAGGRAGVKIWHLITQEGNRMPALESLGRIDEGWSRQVCFCPQSRLLAYNIDSKVKVWDILKKHELASPENQQAYWFLNLHFTPQGQLEFANDDGHVELWDYRSPESPTSTTFATVWNPQTAGNFHSALSGDGAWLAADIRQPTKIDILELASHRELFSLESQTGAIWSLGWSPDRKKLAVGCEDGSLSIWSLNTLERQLTEIGLPW